MEELPTEEEAQAHFRRIVQACETQGVQLSPAMLTLLLKNCREGKALAVGELNDQAG